MGVEVAAEGLCKSFGQREIWRDVSLTLPPGEVSVLLGPSGAGKSAFLKCLIGLLKPDAGRVVVGGVDLGSCGELARREIRKLFGVLFQGGNTLNRAMSLYDNVAFTLREQTDLPEAQIRRIAGEKMEMVGLAGQERKLPGEVSGGKRKRTGLASALVLDPQIILCDEPDSGLAPAGAAYLSQLLIDLNAQTDATILIVTHNVDLARAVPDNIGVLFRRRLVMFGPREVLLTADEPVVKQFINGRRFRPTVLGGQRDHATLEQLRPSEGLPRRLAEWRRKDRVMGLLPKLPAMVRDGILASLDADDRLRYGIGRMPVA